MTRDTSLDIAVTGLAVRLPGGPDLAQFWSALLAGRTLTTRYDRGALLDAGVSPSLVDDPDYVPVRGHLPDADRFDAAMFAISPREAELMDPQHRLMLESVWCALEDAGVDPSQVSTTTGVYASATGSDYLRSMVAGGRLDPVTLEDALHGGEPDFMAGRIAYKLGLTGPAMAVQTACSSALVGLHLAIQALWNGDCDQAVVVAAGLGHPQGGHLYLAGGIHSRTGRCRPFDADADGTVGGSGVASVVLRRLDDLDADSPEPHGVILGTAVNNDATARAGFYAPSPAGQEAVILAALRAAGVGAETIGYLETHGTATRLGDSIEWSAASAALTAAGARPGQVAIGATKANIGHLDAAAGLVGLIKALLVVRHGQLPPVAGFTRLNPHLEGDGSPLFVPTAAGQWGGAGPRRAGVSSFGIGGTNAHVVVEAPPPAPARHRRVWSAPHLVVVSAADPEALDRSAQRIGRQLRTEDCDIADLAHTLVAGRAALPQRLAVVGRTPGEIAAQLSGGPGAVRGHGAPTSPVIFLFPGQGAQRPGMAIPYAEALPGFRAALDHCLEAFAAELAATVRSAVLSADFPAADLMATSLAQPALFAVEYAAATALTELGIAPSAVLGHSLGDIAAACIAGGLDLADAARLAAVRGRAMAGCPKGAMLAVSCGEGMLSELLAACGIPVELAAVNTHEGCVVAGTRDAVGAFQEWLGDRTGSTMLRTDRAFHSALIEPALPALAKELTGMAPRTLRLPMVGAGGRIVSAGTRLEPGGFVGQARQPVRFWAALEAAAERFPGAVTVELGPGRTLSAFAESAGLTSVPTSPRGPRLDGTAPLLAVGLLWVLGQPVDLPRLSAGGRMVHLPGYPFAGPRWLAPEAAPSHPPPGHTPVGPASHGPSPHGPDASTDGEVRMATRAAPTTAEVLAGLWAELLGYRAVRDESDFFDLGGDSLTIVRLARRLHRELGVRVPIRDMLAARTLGRQRTLVLELLEASAAANPGRAVKDH